MPGCSCTVRGSVTEVFAVELANPAEGDNVAEEDVNKS